MPACASQPTAFSSPSAAFSPPSGSSSAGGSKHLRYPQASGRGALPVRPERHVPHSIASIRRQLAVRLVKALPRCPCCQRQRRGGGGGEKTQKRQGPFWVLGGGSGGGSARSRGLFWSDEGV